jgi:colicin import membrane protein
MDGRASSVDAACAGGDAAFERSAEAAVRKAAPFPMPPDPAIAAQLLGQTVSFRFNPD